MSACPTCVCSPSTVPGAGSSCPSDGAGRMLVSAPAGHLARAVGAAGRIAGLVPTTLGPRLWELRGPGPALDGVVTALRGAVSAVEAAEVRVLVDDGTACGHELLVAAMSAPTLDQLDARVRGEDLLDLFADEEERFRAAYQPIVELPGRSVIGYEALLRPRTAAGVELAPQPLFEQAQRAGWHARLDRIGRTVALRDAGGGWLGPDRSLFINFVPTSIYDPKVCLATTEVAAAAAGIDLRQVVFEVTESEQVTDLAHLQRVFAHYRDRGCRVALDDLGAGYSSLDLLVRLEPDIVKLDRTLVEHLPGGTSAAVIRAVVDITHAYGGLVLAEGVETEEQSDAVTDLGVDLGQGWLYGRPAFPPAPLSSSLLTTPLA